MPPPTVAQQTAALHRLIVQKKEDDAIALLDTDPAPDLKKKVPNQSEYDSNILVAAAKKGLWKLVVALIEHNATFEYDGISNDNKKVVELIFIYTLFQNANKTTLSPEAKAIVLEARPIVALLNKGILSQAKSYINMFIDAFDEQTPGKLAANQEALFIKIIDAEVARTGLDAAFNTKVYDNFTVLDKFWMAMATGESAKPRYAAVHQHLKDIGLDTSGGPNAIKNPIYRLALTEKFHDGYMRNIYKVYTKLNGRQTYAGHSIFTYIVGDLGNLEQYPFAGTFKTSETYMLLSDNRTKIDISVLIKAIYKLMARDKIDAEHQDGSEWNSLYIGLLNLGMALNAARISRIWDTPGYEMTPMHFAVKHQSIKLLNGLINDVYGFLISCARWVNKLDATGHSPLHLAAKLDGEAVAGDKGYDIVKILIGIDGVDLDTKSSAGKTACDIARESGAKKRTIALLCGEEEEEEGAPYKGMSRGDAALLDDVLTPEGLLKIAQCPVCLELIRLEEWCNYMTHNCSATAEHYHKGLYNKYKNPQGSIVFCIRCGRACVGHAHYRLAWAHDPKPDAIFIEGADPYEVDCTASGGGGVKEKIARFQRFREFALTMQGAVGKMPAAKVHDMLTEATWNAPFTMTKPTIEKIISKMKWNLPTELFPSPPPPPPAPAGPPPEYNDPSKYAAPTISDAPGMNEVTYVDDEWVVQFNHDRGGAGARLGAGHKKIGKDGLLGYLQSSKGRCFDAACGGLLWPAEVDAAVQLWKAKGVEFSTEDVMMGNTRIIAETKIIKEYRARFSREQMPAVAGAGGGGGGAGLQGGGRSPKSVAPLAPTNSLMLLRAAKGVGCALPGRISSAHTRKNKITKTRTRTKTRTKTRSR